MIPCIGCILAAILWKKIDTFCKFQWSSLLIQVRQSTIAVHDTRHSSTLCTRQEPGNCFKLPQHATVRRHQEQQQKPSRKTQEVTEVLERSTYIEGAVEGKSTILATPAIHSWLQMRRQ
jgi:hypothetical protein